MRIRHGRAHNNRNSAPSYNQEPPHLLESRHVAIAPQNRSHSQSQENLIRQEDMPFLRHEARMEERVHRRRHGG